MRYFLEFYAIQVLVFILSLLPLSFSCGLAKQTGNLFYLCAASRRKVALENLDRAYGNTLSLEKKKDIARQAFQNTALSILELFLTQKTKKTAARDFKITGQENMEDALSQGRGVILVTSHLGSWEYLAFLFYLAEIPCSVIVKSIKNPYLDKKIDSLRREMAVTPIPKKNAIRETLTELRDNHVVAVLIDQWAGHDGLWIDFFGAPTSTTSLPARLARQTGSLLVPAYCLRKNTGQYEILILPAVPLPGEETDWETKVTQSLNKMLEEHIRTYPEQWSWAHKRWKTKPATSRQT